MADEGTGPERGPSVLIFEAAEVLGVSRRTVYYWIRERRLQTIRTRCGSQRVLWSSIESCLRQAQQQARPEAPAESGLANG